MFIEETKSKELKSFLIKIHDDILAGIKHGFSHVK